MFGELIAFVNVLTSAADDIRSRRKGKEREASVSTLLRTYFFLKDAADEGELLVEDAEPNPVSLISSLEPQEAQDRLRRWDYALRRQTFRLMRISDMIYGQDFMDVVSPELRERLNDVLGSKFHRTTSLHGIGAALFFRGFGSATPEEQARYVSIMAGEEDDLLHMDKIRAEISALREALQSYHLAVNQLSTPEELMRLSTEARSATSLPPPPDAA